ncbi:hypothetical protein BDY19DRAFT_938114 [Irpex rosettiformis]|uniref:Uncharacterized protein n=1 Tax=Irpex rosettiformis TaxID=378272 RepID=A0ACB8U9M3_9APHY|nr:hypothetical protein BDY19DRAFT_938114 [Irpex rosettiformis]
MPAPTGSSGSRRSNRYPYGIPPSILELQLKGLLAYEPDGEGRTRYIGRKYTRDDGGGYLPNPGPLGKRTPNNIIWGHDLDEILWISRFPGEGDLSRVQTVWSRSMIKEYGENYIDEAWRLDSHYATPHFRKPWPVLMLKVAEDDHINDYLFDDQIEGFNQIWERCPDGPFAHLPFRRPVPEDKEEEKVVDPSNDGAAASSTVCSELKRCEEFRALASGDSTESSGVESVDKPSGAVSDYISRETEAEVALDDYQPLQQLKRNARISCYPDLRESAYKKQGRTAELRAFRSTYDYKPYAAPDPGAHAPRNSPFSVKDIPKLEETIPDAFMPDYLLVHDPHDVTCCANDALERTEDKLLSAVPPPRKYRRVFPEISKTVLDIPEICKTRETIAHLYLHQKNRFGVGHHSLVYRAPLALPPPLSAHSRNGKVIVTAKLAMHNLDDQEMLRHEAMIYNKMPKHMSEDWCGYNFVAPVVQPVPVGPVVPKFYGFYEPVEDDERYPYKRECSPILLMEECGRPIVPKRLSADERTECLSLMFRLHLQRFVQNSFFIRNILRQPGPLYRPPEERSDDTPSFRIIDFGRASLFKYDEDDSFKADMEIREEQKLARTELGLDPLGFSW